MTLDGVVDPANLPIPDGPAPGASTKPRLNGPMVERLRRCAADTDPNWAGAITIYPPEARELVALIDHSGASVEPERRTPREWLTESGFDGAALDHCDGWTFDEWSEQKPITRRAFTARLNRSTLTDHSGVAGEPEATTEGSSFEIPTDTIRALFAFWDCYHNQTGFVDVDEPGVAAGIVAEDALQLDQLSDFIEPHEGFLRDALSAPESGSPIESPTDRGVGLPAVNVAGGLVIQVQVVDVAAACRERVGDAWREMYPGMAEHDYRLRFTRPSGWEVTMRRGATAEDVVRNLEESRD